MIKVEGETASAPVENNVKAALARLASNENLNTSYDLVLGNHAYLSFTT